jgi:hypothetical protein
VILVFIRKRRPKLLRQKKIQELRNEERVSVSHQVNVANTKGITWDISASGVYIEADATFCPGEKIAFVVEFGKQGVNFILKCSGQIIRVENRNGKAGAAIKILESVMESA